MPFVARLAMMHRCDAVGRAVCGGPGAVLCRRGAYHLDAVWVRCRGASCRRDDAVAAMRHAAATMPLPRCVMPASTPKGSRGASRYDGSDPLPRCCGAVALLSRVLANESVSLLNDSEIKQ